METILPTYIFLHSQINSFPSVHPSSHYLHKCIGIVNEFMIFPKLCNCTKGFGIFTG